TLLAEGELDAFVHLGDGPLQGESRLVLGVREQGRRKGRKAVDAADGTEAVGEIAQEDDDEADAQQDDASGGPPGRSPPLKTIPAGLRLAARLELRPPPSAAQEAFRDLSHCSAAA